MFELQQNGKGLGSGGGRGEWRHMLAIPALRRSNNRWTP